VRLRLELVSHGGNTAGFEIPDPVVEDLGAGRRPKVVVTVGPHTWRSSIARMGDRFMLGMSQEKRALAVDSTAAATWATWSFTRQKEAARQLTEAKKPETRARRLEKVLADLAG